MHPPDWQTSLPSQVFSQPPQCSSLLEASTHWPSQAIRLPEQSIVSQVPLLQVSLVPHSFSHSPQWLRLLDESTQVPSHAISPSGQAHWPD